MRRILRREDSFAECEAENAGGLEWNTKGLSLVLNEGGNNVVNFGLDVVEVEQSNHSHRAMKGNIESSLQ